MPHPSDEHPEAIPAENGRRAAIDPKTGEVHGSGVGAGGSSPGENFDQSAGDEPVPPPQGG